MNLLKEYKWWLLFVIGLAIAMLTTDIFFPDTADNKLDVVSNWEQNKDKIISSKQHFKSLINKSYFVYIEFGSSGMINDIQLTQFGDDNIHLSAKNVTLNSLPIKEICRYLNCGIADLRIVYENLNNTNCCSIANSDPFHVGLERDGPGKYSYAIFDGPIADSMFKVYNDTCRFKYYDPNLLLEYRGGATGPQCFPAIIR